MNRRDVVFASLALGSMPISAWTQQAGKVWRIGVLSLFVPPEPGMQQTIVRMLAPYGYEQGRNLIIDYKFAQGKADQLPTLAAQLLATTPDLLIGLLNDEIKVLKQVGGDDPNRHDVRRGSRGNRLDHLVGATGRQSDRDHHQHV